MLTFSSDFRCVGECGFSRSYLHNIKLAIFQLNFDFLQISKAYMMWTIFLSWLCNFFHNFEFWVDDIDLWSDTYTLTKINVIKNWVFWTKGCLDQKDAENWSPLFSNFRGVCFQQLLIKATICPKNAFVVAHVFLHMFVSL